MLTASYWDDRIAWYENDGNENFFSHPISIRANGATSVYAIDLDGDGNIDVLSASSIDDKIAWYENLGVVGIKHEENEIPLSFNLNQNYPNPFNPSTKIRYSIPQLSKVQVRVFDVLGNEVKLY